MFDSYQVTNDNEKIKYTNLHIKVSGLTGADPLGFVGLTEGGTVLPGLEVGAGAIIGNKAFAVVSSITNRHMWDVTYGNCLQIL